MVVAMVVSNIVRFSFLGREGFGKRKKEKWETAMEEMFSDAMNEAFEDEEGDDDDDDDKKKKGKNKTNDDDDDDDNDDDDSVTEEFTGRFEGFETKEKASLQAQVKQLQKDVEKMKLDM